MIRLHRRHRPVEAGVCFLMAAAGLCAQTGAKLSLAQAAELIRGQKPKEAEAVLRGILEKEPANAGGWNLLGAALDSQSQCGPAEQAFRKAGQLAPSSAGVWNNLGNHYLACGEPAKAREPFRKVLALEPSHANANLQLARLAVEQRDGAEALRRLDRLSRDDLAQPAVLLLRARALSFAGRKAEALVILDGLEKQAEGAAAWDRLATALAEAGEFTRAEALLSRALEAEPSNPEMLRNLGMVALQANHPARAREIFEAALRLHPEEPDLWRQLGRSEAAQGRFEEAFRALDKARKLSPKDTETLRLSAQTSAQAGFFADAVRFFDELLKLNPAEENARLQRGLASVWAGDKPKALADLQWYVSRHPNDGQGHFGLGLAFATDDPARALEHFTEAIRLRPDDAQSRLARGGLLVRAGRAAEARTDLEYVLHERPGDLETIDLLGRALLMLGKPKEAVEVLQRGYEKAPHDPGILQSLGGALKAAGNEAEGTRLLREFAQAGPERAVARSAVGLLSPAEQRARYEKTLRELATARPEDAALRAKLAAFLLSERKTDEAVRFYRAMLERTTEVPVLVESAHDLMRFGKDDLAVEFLRRALSLRPSADTQLDLAAALSKTAGAAAAMQELDRIPPEERKGDYFLLRAELLDTLDQVKEAGESLRLALAREPERPDLYRSAMLFFLEHGQDLSASGLLENAARVGRDDRELQLVRAVVLARGSRFEESHAVLEEISRSRPEWSRPYLVRGMVELSQYRQEEALRSIRTAIDLGEQGAEAYFYLGMALLQVDPEQWKPALEAAKKAAELSPDDPWAKILAGRILKQAGQYEAAIRVLREVVSSEPDLAQAHFWLGSTLLAMGDNAKGQGEMAEVDHLRERNPGKVRLEDWGLSDKLFALADE